MILTIELPENLNKQLRERHVPEEEIKAVVLAALEIWLAEQPPTKDGPFTASAITFIRRLIAQNRELFEMLAQR
jgi:hypothetical protein